MQFGVKFINDNQAAFAEGKKDYRKCCYQLFGAIGLIGKGQFIFLRTELSLHIKLVVFFIKAVIGDINVYII